MLGDGWLNHHDDRGNPFFGVGSTTREFLEWYDDEMGILTTGVREASGSDISKQQYYKVRSRRLPWFNTLREWYTDDGIQYPDVDLTPLTLKLWYVSDGWLQMKGEHTSPTAVISNKNQEDPEEYFRALFEPLSLSPWVHNGKIEFSAGDTREFFDYLGDPVPGFAEKFPGASTRTK